VIGPLNKCDEALGSLGLGIAEECCEYGNEHSGFMDREK
jgi:hypothetical protein